MKEALVNYVEAVSDKVQNVGQCKMAASAVTALTEGEISMKTRVIIIMKRLMPYENVCILLLLKTLKH